MPPDAAGSPPGFGDCMKKPSPLTRVTIPWTFSTCWFSKGERCPAPWISAIVMRSVMTAGGVGWVHPAVMKTIQRAWTRQGRILVFHVFDDGICRQHSFETNWIRRWTHYKPGDNKILVVVNRAIVRSFPLMMLFLLVEFSPHPALCATFSSRRRLFYNFFRSNFNTMIWLGRSFIVVRQLCDCSDMVSNRNIKILFFK